MYWLFLAEADSVTRDLFKDYIIRMMGTGRSPHHNAMPGVKREDMHSTPGENVTFVVKILPCTASDQQYIRVHRMRRESMH